jgi:hypothetical protein
MSLSIRSQLFAGFGVLAILVLAIGAIGVTGARSSSEALRNYQASSSQGLEVNQAKIDLLSARLAAFAWRTTGADSHVESFEVASGSLVSHAQALGLEETRQNAEGYRQAFDEARGSSRTHRRRSNPSGNRPGDARRPV